jgi:hypothetical protein
MCRNELIGLRNLVLWQATQEAINEGFYVISYWQATWGISATIFQRDRQELTSRQDEKFASEREIARSHARYAQHIVASINRHAAFVVRRPLRFLGTNTAKPTCAKSINTDIQPWLFDLLFPLSPSEWLLPLLLRYVATVLNCSRWRMKWIRTRSWQPRLSQRAIHDVNRRDDLIRQFKPLNHLILHVAAASTVMLRPVP